MRKKLLLALLCLVGIVSTQASSCNAPAGLTASSITKTSATLSWTPGDAGDTQWLVIYGPAAGSEDEISRTVTTNPYTLTGLNPGTDYNVWVKTDCGGEYSFAAYQSFRTNDKTVITACALQGYDGSSIKVGTTYTYQFGQTIARAITPINAAAPYTTSLSGGSLFKKDDEGRFMQVADNTVLEAGEYIFVIMLHIIQPEATDYRFPRTDEGITVDVTVDGVTWSANPRNYQDGGQTGSSIMCGCPAFVLSNDDPAEIEAAKEELESLSLYSGYLMNEVTDPALLAKLSQVKSTANTVLGNPNATLAELNDAITTCNQILEESGSTYFEAYRDMLIADVHDNVDMTYPSLTQACQALIDQFFSDMEALTYNSSLSFLENMEYLVDQYEQNIGTVEGAMLSGDCGSSEEALDDVQPDKLQGTKLLRDGRLFILRNGKTYNAQGAEVR